MKWDWKREMPAAVLLASMFLTAAAAWSRAPERLPVHWSIAGQPNRWGGRAEGLLGLPLTALGLYLLLWLLPRIDPRRAHYNAFARAYATMRTVLVGALFALQLIKIVRVDAGTPIGPRVIPLLLAVVALAVGNYLPKVQSNWFVGVRTPWTLSSEESWRRTHRLAGWLFVATGLVSMTAAIAWPGAAISVFLGLLAISAASSVVYSYVVWRHDPGRTPPADVA